MQHARTIPASARVMGLYLLAYCGSGKSRMLVRLIAMQDFLAGRPQVIFDPVDATIDNFLDKVTRFLHYVPASQRSAFWDHITNVDMSGKDGFITPFPLYYCLGTERSLLEIAERYLQVIIKSNPVLLMPNTSAGLPCIAPARIPAWCWQRWDTRLLRLKIFFAGLSSGRVASTTPCNSIRKSNRQLPFSETNTFPCDKQTGHGSPPHSLR
jgi:hypothetical protein